MNLSLEQSEALRHAVREFLALRHPAAFPVRAIRRKLAGELDFNFTEDDVSGACEFLIGLEQVRLLPDELGATLHYSATSAGVLAHERGH